MAEANVKEQMAFDDFETQRKFMAEIRKAADERNIIIPDIVAGTGMSYNMFTYYSSCKSRIPLERVCALARMFGISLDKYIFKSKSQWKLNGHALSDKQLLDELSIRKQVGETYLATLTDEQLLAEVGKRMRRIKGEQKT